MRMYGTEGNRVLHGYRVSKCSQNLKIDDSEQRNQRKFVLRNLDLPSRRQLKPISSLQEIQEVLINLLHTDRRKRMRPTRELFQRSIL